MRIGSLGDVRLDLHSSLSFSLKGGWDKKKGRILPFYVLLYAPKSQLSSVVSSPRQRQIDQFDLLIQEPLIHRRRDIAGEPEAPVVGSADPLDKHDVAAIELVETE
jgi:hypothetical protein